MIISILILGGVEGFKAKVSGLYGDIIRILNEYDVNVRGHNVNIDNAEFLEDAWNEIEDLLVIFIGQHDIAAHQMVVLADNIADLFMSPDTDTINDALEEIDFHDTFYQFFIFEALIHQQNINDLHIDHIDPLVLAWQGHVPIADEQINEVLTWLDNNPILPYGNLFLGAADDTNATAHTVGASNEHLAFFVMINFDQPVLL